MGGSEILGLGVPPIFFSFFFQFLFPQKIFLGCTPDQCAVGMHPTGMHSCYCLLVLPFVKQDLFHVVKPLMSILALLPILSICEKPQYIKIHSNCNLNFSKATFLLNSCLYIYIITFAKYM